MQKSVANVRKGSEADIRRESEFLFRCYSDPRSRIRKIAPEFRRPKRTDAKFECAPRLPGNGIERYYGAKLYAVSSRIFKQYRNILDCVAERDPGGAANGGDDEERAAAMKANQCK